MLIPIKYLVAYVIIGIVAGLVSKRFMIESEKLSRGALAALGAIAALATGAGAFMLLQLGRIHEQRYGWRYEDEAIGMAIPDLSPDVWLSLMGAAVGALIAISAYKLLRDREKSAEV